MTTAERLKMASCCVNCDEPMELLGLTDSLRTYECRPCEYLVRVDADGMILLDDEEPQPRPTLHVIEGGKA